MSERLQLRGRLVATIDLITSLETGIGIDIDEARILLDRHAPKDELEPARIKVVADRICESVEKLKALKRQADLIKKDLGE